MSEVRKGLLDPMGIVQRPEVKTKTITLRHGDIEEDIEIQDVSNPLALFRAQDVTDNLIRIYHGDPEGGREPEAYLPMFGDIPVPRSMCQSAATLFASQVHVRMSPEDCLAMAVTMPKVFRQWLTEVGKMGRDKPGNA